MFADTPAVKRLAAFAMVSARLLRPCSDSPSGDGWAPPLGKRFLLGIFLASRGGSRWCEFRGVFDSGVLEGSSTSLE